MENKKQEQLDLLAKKAFEHDKRFDGQDKTLGEHGKQIETLQSSVDDMKDKVLTALDENTKLLKDVRQEQNATSIMIGRIGDKVDEYDKRITKLEQKVGV